MRLLELWNLLHAPAASDKTLYCTYLRFKIMPKMSPVKWRTLLPAQDLANVAWVRSILVGEGGVSYCSQNGPSSDKLVDWVKCLIGHCSCWGYFVCKTNEGFVQKCGFRMFQWDVHFFHYTVSFTLFFSRAQPLVHFNVHSSIRKHAPLMRSRSFRTLMNELKILCRASNIVVYTSKRWSLSCLPTVVLVNAQIVDLKRTWNNCKRDVQIRITIFLLGLWFHFLCFITS